LLLSGARSDVVSSDTVSEFLQRVPHAMHVEIAQATHMVAGDANDAFTREVTRFVQNLTRQEHAESEADPQVHSNDEKLDRPDNRQIAGAVQP